MDYERVLKLRKKFYFRVEDVRDIFKIKQASARVLCNRYVRKKVFIRLKNNFYVLEQSWQNFSGKDFFKISNLLQVPSYVSCMSALAFYGISTQVQQGFFESASLKRSVTFSTKGASFKFYKIKKGLYSDFVKYNDIFIASKEKAFIDAVYLYSFGKYKCDFSSLDLDKLEKNKIKKILVNFPEKTKKIVTKICKI